MVLAADLILHIFKSIHEEAFQMLWEYHKGDVY